MSLKECLESAVSQGAINSRQRDELLEYFEERFAKNREHMNEAAAKTAAREEVSKTLREKAARQARNALLSEAKRKELKSTITDFKKNTQHSFSTVPEVDAALSVLSNFGGKGIRSMEGRYHAIVAMAHRDLAEAMHHFRRTAITGRRRNLADTDDLVRALSGENINNPALKRLADALDKVREDLRLRFNRAGGDMPKREGFDMNHKHDVRKLLKLDKDRIAARDKWKKFIRPLLDPELMTDPRTGHAVGQSGLDEALDYSWESIISDGWAHHNPQARAVGNGSIANQYQDSRFLQFKGSDAWLAYNREFGDQDVVANIFNQVNQMSRDIAALETLGPNPEAQIEWLKQVIQTEIGKKQAGVHVDPFAGTSGMDGSAAAAYRIDALWKYLRGRPAVWQKPAKLANDVRNVATSAMLGSTSILAAATDPVISATSRYLAGLPVVSFQQSLVSQMIADIKKPGGKLRAAKRAIIWEDYLHVMNEENRFVDQMFGHEWSKYLVDRSLTVNGLIPLTNARKRLEATAWHSELGDLAKADTDWIDLDPRMQRTMEGFGLTADHWHKMRGAVDEIGFLDPGSVLDKTGDRELAEAYAEMIAQWNERSVPSKDPRTKSAIVGKSDPGTLGGELLEFATQFLSFGMSFTARQLEATYLTAMTANSRAGKIGRGAGYVAAMSVPLMLGAATYEQIKAVLDGRDPEDVTSLSFWGKAFVKGGGGGLFADFLDRTGTNRFGQGFKETLPGPGVSLIEDTFDMTVFNLVRLIAGDDFNYGRQVSNYVGRYTPVLSSHPATRLAYRRHIVDNLQWLANPEAHKSFRAKQRRNSHWWEPGNHAPDRSVDFGTAFGN
ncbi:MAG: hypothetical protein AAF478_03470 [Pseudomonadota bacterium]